MALKLLPPHTLQKLGEAHHLRREALALSRLNHRAIVVIHDFVSTRRIEYLGLTDDCPGSPAASDQQTRRH